MDSEQTLAATPEQIARITRTALAALSETHFIVPKDEMSQMLDDYANQTSSDLWTAILTTYTQTLAELDGKIPAERMKGLELAEKVLNRMHSVFLEEFLTVFGANHPENSETDN